MAILMSKKTRARYETYHKWVSLLALVSFLVFLIVPLRGGFLSYVFLAAAIVLLLVAAVLKTLLIKGIPLQNDLDQVRREAGEEHSKGRVD